MKRHGYSGGATDLRHRGTSEHPLQRAADQSKPVQRLASVQALADGSLAIQRKLEIAGTTISPERISQPSGFKTRLNKIISPEARSSGLMPNSIRTALIQMADPTSSTQIFAHKRGAVHRAIRDVYINNFGIQPDRLLKVGALSVWSRHEKIKNHVRKLTYPIDGQLVTGYFKPNQRGEKHDELPEKARDIGINADAPGYANREVAASRVGKMLSPDTTPTTELASYQMDGDAFIQGHIQREAPGDMASGRADLSFEDMAMVLPDQLTNNPAFNESLIALQALDYLIGNVDRHLENYMISGNDAVPIDSEMSFPEVDADDLGAFNGSTFAGLPKGYPDRIAQAVARIDDAWVQANLESLLNPAQLAKFKLRLAAMKQDIEDKAEEVQVLAPPEGYKRAGLN